VTGPPDERVDGLAVRGLCASHGARAVLRDVTFTVPKGAVTVLVGPSGSGKSTLLRCLNRLLVPDAGTVLLDATDTAALEPCALRQRVGLVGQTPVMLPGSTRDNLAYGLGPAGAADAERLTPALHAAGLDADFLERTASELSGGERARVALARALTREPELLLLDEPTAALDADVVRHVATTLRSLARDGLGVVVATHDLAFAAAVADAVVTLRDGTAASGSPAELLA
jgi:ABC-type cobalamin/Fe3+-siderophores transport system ATPase subunit